MDNPTVSPPAAPLASHLLDRKGQVYEPAVSPRLKFLLALIFVGFALLGATGLYLTAISLLNAAYAPKDYTSSFTHWIILVHTAFGALLVLPFLIFGFLHWTTARKRRNRRAVRLGIMLFWTGVVVCVSGLALMQIHDRLQLPTGTVGRWIVYGLHVAVPVLAILLYILHRRAGPDIQWKWGIGWGACVSVFIAAMLVMHSQDPRKWYLTAPKEGDAYFDPSATRTVGGKFVSAKTYMMDEYCKKCHEDIYKDHLHSAHKFSSFNNPAYLISVRETREKAGIRASRWCAGCHDPVPFLSGQFDDPKFDDVNNPTAHAGITCTVCHAMTHVNSTRGNGDYVIEEPQHYPFAFSKNSTLQWVNERLIKAKPDFHKKTFLKPFHKTAEFCSTCHKVSLPVELNQYKEFLRGQDHYNTYLLSGVSGVGTRSFYYPEKAKTNCAQCHMPLEPSNDFGARDFDNTGVRKRHSHFFPAANTGLPWLIAQQPHRSRGDVEGALRAVKKNAEFLRGTDPEGKDRKLRIDLFGIKTGGAIDGTLTRLRPELPALTPGASYLVEVVIRTVAMGHPFTQGTADSNEIWVHFEAKNGQRTLGRSGFLEDRKGLKGESKYPDPDLSYVTLDDRPVDPWSHFVNLLVLSRRGERINRRNPQDIFTPLYNHQIPPGAGQVVHYRLDVPKDVDPAKPIRLRVRLRYRKFDFEYMSIVHGNVRKVVSQDGSEHVIAGNEYHKVPQLPVVDLCEDEVLLPIAGGALVKAQKSVIAPEWQRWNDYGIGCLLEGGPNQKKGELLQAREAFRRVAEYDSKDARAHGHINQARVAIALGYYDQARELLARVPSPKEDKDVPWWTAAWLMAQVNVKNGYPDKAVADLEKILDPKWQRTDRHFDFRRDFVILNNLGEAYFEWAKASDHDPSLRDKLITRAIRQYERTLAIEPEDIDAHGGLVQVYRLATAQGALPRRDVGVMKPDEIAAAGSVFADPNRSVEERLEAASRLAGGLASLSDQAFKTTTKRPLLDELLRQCRLIRDEEADRSLQSAAAFVLGQVHSQLYTIFKLDDAAERVKQIYREKPENKPADLASQAIVIYPLR